MTGYGRADGLISGRPVLVEIRSFNHRYRDVRLSLPREWLAVEIDVDRLIRERIGRGRLECQVRRSIGEKGADPPRLDIELAAAYFGLLGQIAERLGMDEAPTLEMVARSEGVLERGGDEEEPEAIRGGLLDLVSEALVALDASRAAEGARLAAALADLLAGVRQGVSRIVSLAPEEQAALEERTAARIRSLAGQADFPEERLVQEMAVLAERCDVTEELARLESHIQQFDDLMASDGTIGRELDFMLQEMNREVTTLCSKFRSADVVHLGVSIKAEIEKIREQVQNVE